MARFNDTPEREETRRRANIEFEHNQNYIKLNNRYLEIQRGVMNGSVKFDVHLYNELWELLRKAYQKDDPMILWWGEEIDDLEILYLGESS